VSLGAASGAASDAIGTIMRCMRMPRRLPVFSLCLALLLLSRYADAFMHEAQAQTHAPAAIRVVVVISANAEWKPVKEALQPARVERSPYGEFFTHAIAGEPVLFLHGGWGKIDAAASAEYAISRWRPQLLINLGTCGGLQGRMQRLERLLVSRTVVYDIKEAMGDSAEAIAAYSTAIDLGWIGDAFPLRHRRAAMYSADRDLVPSAVSDLTRRFPDVVAADWESASIARVANRRQTRVLILRAASDLVSETHGEAAGNLSLFHTNAATSMRLLLDDLRAIVPYVVPRLSAAAAAEDVK
jgi:adenosylhomocysteine nucleosidase